MVVLRQNRFKYSENGVNNNEIVRAKFRQPQWMGIQQQGVKVLIDFLKRFKRVLFCYEALQNWPSGEGRAALTRM